MSRNSLVFVKHTGQWLIDEIITRRIAFEKGENKKYTTLVNVQEKELGAVVCSCSPDGYPDFFFVFIDKNPTLDSALVVPILFKKDKDRPRKSIKINGATYHVGARFPEVHPIKTLYTVPNLQLDTPEKTLEAILNICKQTKTYSLYQEGINLNNCRRNQLPRKALDTILKPTQSKTLYIYKGRIVCHRRGHSIIPATATFYDGSGNKVKMMLNIVRNVNGR